MPDAPYVPLAAAPGEPFACPRCKTVHGWVLESGGQTRLHIGRQRIRSYVGECECGAEIHWSTSTRRLAALLLRLENAQPD